ncbi:hypothetical protein HELRODRAFT_166269 [Helobdella robusta]|uniref:BACK domain-containing protein n=1 Tax=Helobdella robusta TaxID=6412 RepID=T1EXY7_HELRO|nr:hypothetical protein HELRODRAFT_166269 [Helobdella robusta]ESN90585.1 hypothetical protein HELRODRAFT_166269 [Helobdella robusta]
MKKNTDDVVSKVGSTGERMILISKSGGRHPVDRNMLLRTSEYFQGLVNSGMRDARYRELTLECLTNESLLAVRDYLSRLSTNEMESRGTSSLKSLNEVEAGLDGAFYLQINDMIDRYIEMLLKHLNESTCIRILDIANKYLLIDQVVKKVIEYVLKNFKKISDSSKISLSPNEMFRLVASEEINADSEMDIFNLIIRWVLEDQTRKCFAEKLLTEVRYSLMTTSGRQKCTAILNYMNLNISCDADKDSNISRTVGTLFVVGSTKSKDDNIFNMLPVYNFVEACKASSNGTEPPVKFKTGKQGPPPSLRGYNACVVDNLLYLVGGEPFTRNVSVYNPVTAVWSKCCSTHLARRNFYLGGLGVNLYAVSGYTRYFKRTPTVEKYIPSENQWHMVEPLPVALTRLAGCVCNGTIYVSGGCDDRRDVRNLVYKYVPSCNKWFSRAPMLTARCSHTMTCTEKKIFVFGGKKGSIENAMDGEMYDVESDQWSSVLKLKLPVCDSPSIAINNCLYIFQYEILSDYTWRTVTQNINLTKFLKKNNTSSDSSSSSVQGRNANNNNLVTNEAKVQNSPDAPTNDDCQVFRYKHANSEMQFYCHYVGVMAMSDI